MNIVLVNILLNLGLTVVFVVLNNHILQYELEETFVSLALIYGMIVIVVNAFFVAKCCKSTS
jgi:ABC-type branched-subunit amino acid transport system substrate-binding protein